MALTAHIEPVQVADRVAIQLSADFYKFTIKKLES